MFRCAAAAALAATLLVGGGALAESPTQGVRLVLAHPAYRAGRSIGIQVVNHTRPQILRLAERAARRSGDPRPTLIQHAAGTRFDAVRISSGDLVFEYRWSYLIAVRGHFKAFDASVPPGAKVPSGTVITLVVDARTGQVTDAGISHRYPPLAKLGLVTTDLRLP